MELKILVVEQKGESKKSAKVAKPQLTALEKVQKDVRTIITDTAKIATAAAIPMQAIMGEIDYQLSTISYETGDSDYAAHVQQKFNNVTSNIKFGASLAGAGLAGFAYGNIGGAVIAVGTIAATTIVNELQNKQKHDYVYNFNLQADNFKVNYSKARGGETSVYGGGRER